MNPYDALIEALRDALIATRVDAGYTSVRAFTRACGLEGDNDHVQLWRFEKGHVKWLDDPGQRVEDYAKGAGVNPLSIWVDVARRWTDALEEAAQQQLADEISPRS